MPIISAELKKYGAASRPEDDVSASGGAIDANCILEVTQLASNSALEAVSDNAADTMNLTITGRTVAGVITPEVLALTGTTPRVFTTTLERFLKAVLATAPAGNVTIRLSGGGATVAVIPAGKTSASILFIDSSSEAAQTIRYEKEFWRNENGTLTLTNAAITLTADPSASVRIGVAATKGDTVSVANRKAAPGGIVFVDDGVAVDVPGTTLEANTAIGVWVEFTRGAGAAAVKTSYTTQLNGNSI